MYQLEIIFWDVKHGNATFIKTPNGITFVIDLGTGRIDENFEFSPLNYIYNKYGIQRIDELIITHPDMDHIEDILNLRKFQVGCWLRPKSVDYKISEKIRDAKSPNDKRIFSEYSQMCTHWNGSIDWYQNPRNPVVNGNVDIKVWFPTPNIETHLENNHSLVVIVTYCNKKFLLTGDNEGPSWNWLLSNREFIEDIKGTDVLLAPHHGRESGYSDVLFEYIQPYLTIISDDHTVGTSRTQWYHDNCKGWDIVENGQKIRRKCLTTRNDGVINFQTGFNTSGHQKMEVYI